MIIKKCLQNRTLNGNCKINKPNNFRNYEGLDKCHGI